MGDERWPLVNQRYELDEDDRFLTKVIHRTNSCGIHSRPDSMSKSFVSTAHLGRLYSDRHQIQAELVEPGKRDTSTNYSINIIH